MAENKNISDMSVDELLGSLGSNETPQDRPDDIPNTQEETTEFDALLSQLPPREAAPESEWDDYLINSAKLGFTDMLALSAATVETFGVEPVIYYAQNPSKLFDAKAWDLGVDSLKSSGSQWLKNYNKWEEGIALGDPKMPKTGDWMTDYAGTGVRVAADPSNYFIGGPKTVVQGAGQLSKMFGVGVGAEAGGEGGAALAEGTDYETEARLAGSLAGGVISPTGTTLAVKSTAGPVAQIWNKYKQYKADPALVNQQYAGGAAKRFLNLAAKEEGVENLGDILDEFSSIKHLLGDDVKGIPLFVQMADNPVIKSQVIRLIKQDPDFRHTLDKEIANIAKHIDLKANIFFGQSYQPLAGAANFNKQIQTRNTSLIKARQVVDNQIEKLSNRIIPKLSDSQVGERITKLIEKRENLVKGEMSPHYTALKDEARKHKVFMSAEDTSNIYSYVNNNKIRDIFGKGTAVDSKIMKYLKPRRNAEGMLLKPKLSFEQVDSLKREINRLKRGKLTQDEARKLDQLSEVITMGRKNMPGDYNSRLEALDKSYYERVGVPYGSETVKLMGSKKYIEEVVPVILKNESSLNQFLNAAGKEGNNIARLAYGAKIYSKTVKDGVINMPALKVLLRKDKAVIDAIPGMRKEIDTILVDNGRLFKLKGNLDSKVKEAETQVANNFLKKYAGEPDYIDIASKLANRDSMFFKKIQEDMKYLDAPARNAVNKNIQRQFVDHIFQNTGGDAYKFLTAPQNKQIIKEVFGAEYTENLKKLGRLSDSLKRAEVGKYSSNIQASQLGFLGDYGLDVPYLASQYRDRISSDIMKGTRILSRIKQTEFQKSTDETLKEVLLDPEAIKKLANLTDTFNLTIDNPLKLQKIIGILGDALPKHIYGAGKVEVQNRQEDKEVQIQGISY